MNNILSSALFGSSPEMDSQWALSLLPLTERLCSFPHVYIVDSPTFLSFEFENGLLQQKPLVVHPTMVASFSGFIDIVENDTHHAGIPKHYYIYTFESQHGMKIVRYVTYITPNKIINGYKKEKTQNESSVSLF